MNLERDLFKALGRREPPPDIAERVAARIAAQRKSEASTFWRDHPELLRLAAALVAAVTVGLGAGAIRQREQRRERQRGEFAARQLLTALQIASETLNDAQRIVRQN